MKCTKIKDHKNWRFPQGIKVVLFFFLFFNLIPYVCEGGIGVCTYLDSQWNLQQSNGDVGRECHFISHTALEGQRGNSHTPAFAGTLEPLSSVTGIENSFLMSESCVYVCIYVSVCAWVKYLWRLEEGIGPSGAGVTDACEPLEDAGNPAGPLH